MSDSNPRQGPGYFQPVLHQAKPLTPSEQTRWPIRAEVIVYACVEVFTQANGVVKLKLMERHLKCY